MANTSSGQFSRHFSLNEDVEALDKFFARWLILFCAIDQIIIPREEPTGIHPEKSSCMQDARVNLTHSLEISSLDFNNLPERDSRRRCFPCGTPLSVLRNYAIAEAGATKRTCKGAQHRDSASGVDFLAISVFAVSPQTYLGRRPINSRLMIPGRGEREGGEGRGRGRTGGNSERSLKHSVPMRHEWNKVELRQVPEECVTHLKPTDY